MNLAGYGSAYQTQIQFQTGKASDPSRSRLESTRLVGRYLEELVVLDEEAEDMAEVVAYVGAYLLQGRQPGLNVQTSSNSSSPAVEKNGKGSITQSISYRYLFILNSCMNTPQTSLKLCKHLQ